MLRNAQSAESSYEGFSEGQWGPPGPSPLCEVFFARVFDEPVLVMDLVDCPVFDESVLVADFVDCPVFDESLLVMDAVDCPVFDEPVLVMDAVDCPVFDESVLVVDLVDSTPSFPNLPSSLNAVEDELVTKLSFLFSELHLTDDTSEVIEKNQLFALDYVQSNNLNTTTWSVSFLSSTINLLTVAGPLELLSSCSNLINHTLLASKTQLFEKEYSKQCIDAIMKFTYLVEYSIHQMRPLHPSVLKNNEKNAPLNSKLQKYVLITHTIIHCIRFSFMIFITDGCDGRTW